MCNLCNPKRKDWSEKGFYGYSCVDCKVPNRAFIVSEKHSGDLSEEEYKTFTELCKKHYPHLKSKGLSEGRSSCFHWYEFLVKIGK